ncbi:MAG: anion permease, partial [bacterium]|nr:anion permease [bacterium]
YARKQSQIRITAIILLVVVGIMTFWFRKQLRTTPEKMALVAQLDNSNTIKDKALMIRSLIVLALVILGFITHDATHIQTSVCAMAGASFLLLFEKPSDILNDVEWNTIFFFIGLFVIIGGFEKAGGIQLMANWLLEVTHGSQSLASIVILWGSGILSGIIDNIPYTATMTPMIANISATHGAAFAEPMWWCLSLGACLGGNMTIIGAAANVIVSEAAAAKGHKIYFMQCLKYGVVAMLLSLILSTGYIWLRFLG